MTSLLAFVLLRQTPIRVVACDAPVPSRKRGVMAERLDGPDFVALAPGLTWWHNGAATTRDVPPAGVAMEFFPTFEDDLAPLAGTRPRRAFALNEPNLRGALGKSPEQTASLLAKAKAETDRLGLPLIGPQLALGAIKEALSVGPYLKALPAAGPLGVHLRGNADESRKAIEALRKEAGRPLWITEYRHAPNAKAALTSLIQITDLFERSPDVEGYAWSKARVTDKDAAASLLGAIPGSLTPLGTTYVAMPVHDADLYYRVPGRLQAERYGAMAGLEIFPADEEGELAQMKAQAPDATLDYNLYLDSPGLYTIRLRVGGPAGRLLLAARLSEAKAALDVPDGKGWRTVSATLRLPSGAQVLRVTLGKKDQAVDWIEFVR